MMNTLYIVWRDENNIGIPILDEQHRAVVAAINSLYYFIKEGWGLEALKPTLQIVKCNFIFHLKTEEGILAKADYPDIHDQAAYQKAFAAEIDAVARDALSQREPELLLKFLKDWWLNHIKKDHKAYTAYLDSKT